jgi:DNA polymerase-3 subunit delta'
MTSLAPGWRKIVGHEWAVRLLSSAVANERIGHAYLITGPDHIGKMTLARTFAQALNCTAESGLRPCGECRACTLIHDDKHPDVRLILPEVSARGAPSIKIEQIRQLQQDLSLSAYEARYKVALLKRFDTANLNAANAFLKTLEEPPGKVILLLTASDSDTILPTINSRCRTVRLRPIAKMLIEETLMTGHHVKTEEANLLAHLADGRLGWAVRAHGDPDLLRERQAQLDSLYRALGGTLVARFALAESLSRKAEALPPLLRTWLGWWRDVAMLAFGRRTDDSISNIDQVELMHEMAGRWPKLGVLSAFKQTEAALRQLGQNANARLVMENIMLTYPRMTRSA